MTPRRRLAFDRTPMSATTPLRTAAKSLWARLRRKLLQEHGMICMACGYVPPTIGELEGHEVHSFPGGGVIKLEAILLLCRKCHHAVHLERSVSGARDQARWKWEEEHPLSGKRRFRSLAEVKVMVAAVDAATAAYREAMIVHVCKVNHISRRQCECDFEKATPPPDIMQLCEVNRAAWQDRAKNDLELLHQIQLGMITPLLSRARMDYGPFADDFALVEKRRALAREKREQLWACEDLEDPSLYQWPYGPIE